jgi:hypothetical protein
MRITKAYYLSFNNTSTTTQFINIPFKVGTIHVKSIGYDAGNIPAAGTATYVSLFSDLTQNEPLGMVFNDSTYYSNSFQDIYIDLQPARMIQGTYQFNLVGVDGLAYVPVGAGLDRVVIIIEFNELNED